MPLSCIRRFQSITSAAPTSTFFGSQPRRAHVPPNGLESMTATSRPALRQREATTDAADPVPITATSNFLIILSFASSAIARRLDLHQPFAPVRPLAARAGPLPRRTRALRYIASKNKHLQISYLRPDEM